MNPKCMEFENFMPGHFHGLSPAAYPLPLPVPMEVDCTWAHTGICCTCYHCREQGHLARDCTALADVQSVDMLDEVIRQLNGDLLEELVARLSTSASLPEEPRTEVPEDFLPCGE